ncbi:MAG: cytochrome c [Sedimenticolaceae bacterium]
MKNGIALMIAALLASATSAQAEEPENYIKYRQAMMTAIGGHNGAATQIMRGKVDPEGDLVIHANALAALSSNIPRLFPEGSDFGETKAKDEIWSEWDKFEQAANDAKMATAAFSEAVSSGDADRIAKTFKDVGDSCKGCHKEFRQKDD